MSPNQLETDKLSSPRSTVIPKSMETMDGSPAGISGENGASETLKDPAAENTQVKEEARETPEEEKKTPDKKTPEGRSTPQSEAQTNLAPQTYYHLGYEPPSPATGIAIGAYDPASFFQHTGAFMQHSGSFGGPNTPVSPARPTVAMSGIPPASPLFPRMASGGNPSLEPRQGGAPPSPVPYVSPHLGSAMYPSYAAAANPNRTNSSEEQTPTQIRQWVESHGLPPGSPQVGSYPVVSRATAGARAYSFEEMLPPAAMSEENPSYSPYSNGVQGSPGGNVFAQTQQWQYGGPPDMYSVSPGSPLQPRPTAGMHMPYGGMQGGRQMSSYGQYYPASSPGPPIQTTASNKGPDGANLFIFHIPNHFSNLDMYQLFCPYGNLLSVRIMVEKESGRSRGFGFVSYDSPASAAVAIKELNGFAIGNKRLKVQHKQLRQNDREHSHTPGAPPGTYTGAVGNAENSLHRSQFPAMLPPSGAGSSQAPWYQQQEGGGEEGVNPGEEGTPGSVAAPVGSDPAMTLPVDSGSPLATLGALQSSLPDVPGKGGA